MYICGRVRVCVATFARRDGEGEKGNLYLDPASHARRVFCTALRSAAGSLLFRHAEENDLAARAFFDIRSSATVTTNSNVMYKENV